jgi:hypothetical protein
MLSIEVRIAEPIAVPRGEVVDRLDQRILVCGRRHLQTRDAREGHETDLGLAVLGLDEGDGRLLGNGEPVGFDVGGAHGSGDVHRQHDRRGVGRHRHGRLRPRRPDTERREAKEKQQGRDEPGPPRTGWQRGTY